MALGKTLGRLTAMSVGAVALQSAVLATLAAVLEVPVPLVNGAILFFATVLLGAAIATRQSLTRAPRQSASLLMGATPSVATALFVLPRIWTGPSAPATLTVASSLLVAPLLCGVAARFVFTKDAAALGLRRALASGAPPIAIVLTVLAVNHDPVVLGFLSLATLMSIAGAIYVKFDGDRLLREARGYAQYLASIEIGVDEVRRPELPVLTERSLIELDREIGPMLDATARQAAVDARARGQIAEARDLRTRFMAAMSHELRSPLNSILGFSELLEQGFDGVLNDAQLESVVMIRRSSQELILLLTDVLDLARLEAGRLEIRRGWTPSVEILTEAVKQGNAIVEGRDVEIEAQLQPGLPPVYVDSRRIVQAVTALFRSAASSLSKTTIRLRARIEPGPPGPGPHLRVEVHDAIGAISDVEVERIFEAFREITAPAGRRVGGLGMSLALSRELVRMHGGDVWAYTVQEEGPVLCVALPLDGPKL